MFGQHLILLHALLLTTHGEVTNLSLTTISQSFSMNARKEVDLRSHCNLSLMCSESDICPPGLFCEEGACQCADLYPFDIISCNGTASSLLDCNCATWDRDRNVTLTGACVYSCFEVYYVPLPQEIDKLNDKMCKQWNRTGALCGRCLPDHYPLAYSFNLTCVLCPHVGWNWFRYMMAAYLPLTLFYVVILFLKINVTSSYLLAVVVYCQSLSLPALIRPVMDRIVYETNFPFITATKIFLSLYGIWNLDFFRPFYSDICLGMGILPTLALDYAIAVYPLLLMVITYLLIILYDRNYRVIILMWRPFRVLFSYYRRNWDVRTSVIDAYATFFLLSNVKFLSVSFDLLVPVRVYELHQDHYNYSLGLYYAADIEYFGSEHLPYGILAIIMCLFFVILPVTTLALYPFSFFHRFLNLFPVRLCIFIHTFMDAFQGCYKDGTEPGTRDCRWFSSVYFFFRFLSFMLYAFIPNTVFFVLGAIIAFNLSLLIMAIQPFKSSVAHYNLLNAVFIQLLALVLITNLGSTVSDLYMKQLKYFFYVLCLIIYSAGFCYGVFHISYWLIKKRGNCLKIIHRMKHQGNGYEDLSESSEEVVDGVVNPSAHSRENLVNFSSPEK